MQKLLFILFIFIIASCGNDSANPTEDTDSVETNDDKTIIKDGDTTQFQSDYNMETVDADDREEFKENLAKIEKEHGEQWDFCTCVVKNDSINKAVSKPLPDAELDRMFERLEVIDKHCKAFLVQSPNATPEERTKHEKKVKKCLKAAGVK